MTFEDLRVFVAVCESGSLSAAGRTLGCTQSAVSHHVKHLESEYGTPLLERDRTGVTITPAGRVVLDAARVSIRAVQQAHDALRQMDHGELASLRVGTVS